MKTNENTKQKLDNIEFWSVNQIFIDGDLEYGEGDIYAIEDFLRWTPNLKVGGVYLLGFTRSVLCEVVDITSEYCNRGPGYDQTQNNLYLKKIADLDEKTLEIKRMGKNSYLVEINDEE